MSHGLQVCFVDSHFLQRGGKPQGLEEELGGGGHFDAAGAQIKDNDMANALRILKNAIDNYFNAA